MIRQIIADLVAEETGILPASFGHRVGHDLENPKRARGVVDQSSHQEPKIPMWSPGVLHGGQVVEPIEHTRRVRVKAVQPACGVQQPKPSKQSEQLTPVDVLPRPREHPCDDGIRDGGQR